MKRKQIKTWDLTLAGQTALGQTMVGAGWGGGSSVSSSISPDVQTVNLHLIILILEWFTLKEKQFCDRHRPKGKNIHPRFYLDQTLLLKYLRAENHCSIGKNHFKLNVYPSGLWCHRMDTRAATTHHLINWENEKKLTIVKHLTILLGYYSSERSASYCWIFSSFLSSAIFAVD